jgi:uncharacterized protein with HEPN domain
MNDSKTLKLMLEYCQRISSYCHGPVTYETFSQNQMLQDALVHNLEQIGEKSIKISSSFKEKHSEIPWHQLSGIRNRLIHDYEGSSVEIIYHICCEDVPLLERQLAFIVKENDLIE